jgi:hypothetical protein
MSNQQLEVMSVDPKQFGLEETKAVQMTSGLAPTLSEREMLIPQFEQVIQMELGMEAYKAAKELRARIKDNRTKGILPWHKLNKEFYLRGGQFVDAVKNKEIAVNEQMEERLEEIEKHEIRVEEQRKAALREERVVLLLPFEVDTNFVNVEDMSDDVWANYFTGTKLAFEQRKEAERKAEEARLAEIEAEKARIEAQRIENEKLKAEAAEKEKQLEAERQVAAKALADQQEKARKEREAAEAEATKERARIESERQKEAAERARVEAELKAEKDKQAAIEAQRLADEDKARKEAEKMAKAPIKKQLAAWVAQFQAPENPPIHEVSADIINKFQSFKKWAESEIEKI